MPALKLSEAELDRIVELRESGTTYRRIAREIGCSEGSVAWHCLRLGVEPPQPAQCWDGIRGAAVVRRGDHQVRRYTPEEDAELLRLEAEGMRLCEIARRLGRRHNSIRGRLMTLARRDERREAS